VQYNDYVQAVFGSDAGAVKWSHHGIYKPGSNAGPFRYNNKIYRMTYVLESVPEARNGRQRALDLGCGGGMFIPAIVKKGYRVTGIDIAHQMVAMAGELCDGLDVPAALAVGNCNEIGLKSDAFDVCIAVGLIEHQKADRELLKEVYRILKPGGALIITIRNYLCPHVRLQYMMKALFLKLVQRSQNPRLISKFKKAFDSRQHNPFAFRKDLRNAGFKNIRSRFAHFYFLPYPVDRLLPWLETFVAKKMERLNASSLRGLGSAGIYIARKTG
jgi:SAM-dependent methyltransferase